MELHDDVRETTQTPRPQRSSAPRKPPRVWKGQKPAKSPLELPSTVLPTSPLRRKLARRPLQLSPGGGRVENDVEGCRPAHPRVPVGIFSSLPARRRGLPRSVNKPLAAGARASPRPELPPCRPAPSPFKAPPPLPPPLPPPQVPTPDWRRPSSFRGLGEVPPLGGARGGAGSGRGHLPGACAGGGAVAAR